MRTRIALTMGDPAGIGPEIVVKAVADPGLRQLADIVLYGSRNILQSAASRFLKHGVDLNIVETSRLRFEDVPVGKEDADCGIAARDTVIRATRDALDGKLDAIVTAPMNKASVNIAGIPFTGHTELIAELCGVQDYAMMQSAGDLRIAFVTTHIALKDVHLHISPERIIKVAGLLNAAIIREGVRKPVIAVAALNPHAGEQGYMGTEDEEIVKPALKELGNSGIWVEGPFPPDTLFIDSIRAGFDGILAMYHDQGHIPFKMLAFEQGVNSTLGLPIIRCSVDHGTAFGIAWQNNANTGSLFAAIRLAVKRVGK